MRVGEVVDGLDMGANPHADAHAGMHRAGGVSVEVFWADGSPINDDTHTPDVDLDGEPGWWWWACQPGCLPEGDPQGPFVTSTDAYEDAVAAYDEGGNQ